MALFTASVTAEKPVIDVDALRAEVERLKSVSDIRRRYGQNLTDEQVDEIMTGESLQAAKNKRRQEDLKRAQVAEREKRKAIELAAPQLVRDGRIIVSVNGQRVGVGDDLRVGCPHCGLGVPQTAEPVFEYAKLWQETPENMKLTQYSGMLVYSTQGPISHNMGAPMYFNAAMVCPVCKKNFPYVVQLVLV